MLSTDGWCGGEGGPTLDVARLRVTRTLRGAQFRILSREFSNVVHDLDFVSIRQSWFEVRGDSILRIIHHQEGIIV